MESIERILQNEFSLSEKIVTNIVSLIDEGNTIPFIARYRKEMTGAADDALLRKFYERLKALRALNEKRDDILRLIDEQGALTEELKEKILAAKTQTELDDLYRPYRPKRKTRASVAKEKGLLPLAEMILFKTHSMEEIEAFAETLISDAVETKDDAILGAKDIIAELVSDDAEIRAIVRKALLRDGVISVSNAKEEDSTYSMYYDFHEPVRKIANHRILAINRGENEGFLKVSVDIDEDALKGEIFRAFLGGEASSASQTLIGEATDDAYKRLIAPSVKNEVRTLLSERAEDAAIGVFSDNLARLLMQPPLKGKTVMGVDPGYRTGCKIAVVDETGKVLATRVSFFTLPNHDKERAKKELLALITKHNVDVISIGNGTATKESEIFVSELIGEEKLSVTYAITNEAGASVYSASELGTEEFPDFDVAERSAVSIARRLQDPLSELVKIEPKAIGVGQYQHDMNQKRLDEALSGVVESCVNAVGVDLNTASVPLLSHVAGINRAIAKNIVSYREKEGKFKNRRELLKVSKLGEKAFLQCAGFLRISGGDNPLDATPVHPESYKAAEKILSACGMKKESVDQNAFKERVKDLDLKALSQDTETGDLTLKDIIEAIARPTRDVRDDLPKPILKSELLSIENVKEGMVLKGTVRNVIDFGVFVDIGVHQDGLVHISEIADKFIRHPKEVLSVGDVVNVKVIGVDKVKNRISLSIKQA